MAMMIRGDFDESNGTTSLIAGASHVLTNIDTKGADSISVEVVNGNIGENEVITGGDSAIINVNVYGNLGIGYSTIPVAEMELSANSSDICFVYPAIYKMKLEIVNNGAVESAITYRVVVKR